MNSMIIAVAGGTGSGKSYLAENLANTYPKKEILSDLFRSTYLK